MMIAGGSLLSEIKLLVDFLVRLSSGRRGLKQMIKPPYIAKCGIRGDMWIEDGDGVVLFEPGHLRYDEPNLFKILEFFAHAANKLHERQAHAKKIAQKAGRPSTKKPSASTLAKRKSRAKLKKQKPE